LCFALALAATLAAPTARADPILTDDFQDGKAGEWKAMGSGDVRLSTYATNVSLQLKGRAAAVRIFSTEPFSDIAIGLSFAALSLGEGGACVAEASTDAGKTWTVVHAVSHGKDDGVTLHPGGGAVPGLEGKKEVVLRLRVHSTNDAATCWADNVRVTGRRQNSGLPATFDANGVRVALTHDELLNAAASARLVAMSAFAPSANARPATNRFRGRLAFTAERGNHGFTVHRDAFDNVKLSKGDARHLPKFDFAFVQDGDAIIPVRRGAVPDANLEHEFILEPGRVWDEPGDGGYTRAAIPFALEERNANCMHNGVLTFLFKSDGAVSDVAFQVGSETCFYFKYDFWGRIAASYTPGAVDGEASVVAAYKQEVAGRMPVKPLSALTTAYPNARPEKFGSPVEIDAGMMTLYGVVADGVHYVAGCETRFGPYPFCDVMDLPSYSMAKSIFAGSALMRLSLLYPGVAQERIAAFVPECARAGTWSGVTFENALDMATARYNSTGDQEDELAPDVFPFFVAEDHAGKIRFACTHYPRRGTPGTKWIYHSTDTYVLGAAMQGYWRAKNGAGSDIYRDVVAEALWRKLNLSPPTFVTRRTYDAAAQPFAGYGLTLHRDDVAKIAVFLNVNRGRIGGVPQLDPRLLDAAFQRHAGDRGLVGPSDIFRYNNGFWAWNAQASLRCKTPTWIPFMSGYGGIIVALFPNGITYYYFSDAGVWAWATAAIEADRMKPFCER
jgi:hypothetical protein